jgi:hypothetical protein
LDTISSTFLFNSETFKIDNENFDSIMIPIIYNHIIKIGPSLDIKNLTERRLNAFFDTLMSYIPKESFFRLFVPIGWINLSNDFYQKTKNSEVVEYLYNKPTGKDGKIIIDDKIKTDIENYYKEYGAK